MLSYVLSWRQFLFRWSCISTLCCHQYLSHNGRLSPPPFICNQTPFQKHNSLHYVSNAGWIGLWRHSLWCTSVSVTLLKCQAQVIDYCDISQWLGNRPLQTVFHPPQKMQWTDLLVFWMSFLPLCTTSSWDCLPVMADCWTARFCDLEKRRFYRRKLCALTLTVDNIQLLQWE